MADAVPELTKAQREAIRKFFDEHPAAGFKSACRAAGLRFTKDEARRVVEEDEELFDFHEHRLGVAEDDAWRRIADIAANGDHRDQLKANTWILGARHGRAEHNRLEITGAGGGPVVAVDRSASLADVAAVLRRAGALPDDDGG